MSIPVAVTIYSEDEIEGENRPAQLEIADRQMLIRTDCDVLRFRAFNNSKVLQILFMPLATGLGGYFPLRRSDIRWVLESQRSQQVLELSICGTGERIVLRFDDVRHIGHVADAINDLFERKG